MRGINRDANRAPSWVFFEVRAHTSTSVIRGGITAPHKNANFRNERFKRWVDTKFVTKVNAIELEYMCEKLLMVLAMTLYTILDCVLCIEDADNYLAAV